MKRLHWLGILMVIAMLGITGFQFYWLQQNYAREKDALAMKTNLAFRETVMRLRVSKLRLDSTVLIREMNPERGKPRKVFVDKEAKVKFRMNSHKEIISTIDIVRDKMLDSLKRAGKPVIISLNKSTSLDGDRDTQIFTRKITESPGGNDYVFHLLYGGDSLREILQVTEIDSAFRKTLDVQNLTIPFTILRMDSVDEYHEPASNEMTVGFDNPVTYRMELGNSFSYLMRQILQPILFSILLIGITILSFVLLYRNLLQQQRLADLKNEFISNITHELKTPIATVGVAIEALKNFNAMDNPERTREYLDISGHELQRLGLLVDKVLKLSMFEKKKMDIKSEPVNLYHLVEEVLDSLKLQLEKYRAVSSVRQEGDVTLQGDRLHLLSVIFNLLDNALKYSKGTPVIQVDVRGNEKEIILRVADNGIGIAPEYRSRIFEKFFRVPHGETHNAKGYGLGLSYAAEVIRKHGGIIKVEENPGGGTIFTITIPKTRAA